MEFKKVNKTDGEPGLKFRKIPTQNVVTRLFHREIHSCKPGAQFLQARRFYTNVLPNFTAINIEKPPCFLRKFSPNGRYFIAFSADQTSLETYEFQGPAAAEHLLTECKEEYLQPGAKGDDAIKSKLFNVYFKLKHITTVATGGEHLNRECSLFSDCGRYVVIGSAAYVTDMASIHFYQIYRNNECISPGTRFPLEDYTLHIVDTETGIRTDSRQFKCDKISLSHNQGLYLYKNTLAVLSIQQQSIHVFQLTEEGSLIDVRTIGRFCHEDDLLVINRLQEHRNIRAYKEESINCLKHRLLVHLYKAACLHSDMEDNATPLLRFYQYFDQFKNLRMWKMQLLDENHILIKYTSEEVVTLHITDPNSQPSFFVIYNMASTEIVAVFENTSKEFLELFEKYCDLFRNATLGCEAPFTCSPSSNIYAWQLHYQVKKTIVNAKYGGQTEAVRRLLAQLPISAQSYSSSPYLDLALFSYDDKWVSVMERPKTCGDYPIRFYGRESGLLKFRIHSGSMANVTTPPTRRLVAFTFHPFEPFAISVQRFNAEYIVNFHTRHVKS